MPGVKTTAHMGLMGFNWDLQRFVGLCGLWLGFRVYRVWGLLGQCWKFWLYENPERKKSSKFRYYCNNRLS